MQRTMSQEMLRSAAEYPFPETVMPVAAGDDQVSLDFCSDLDNRCSGAGRLHRLDDASHLHIMPLKVMDGIPWRISVPASFQHGEQYDVLCLPQ